MKSTTLSVTFICWMRGRSQVHSRRAGIEGDELLGVQRPHELVHEERVAVGLAHDMTRERLGPLGVAGERVGEEPRHDGELERLEVDVADGRPRPCAAPPG